MMEKRAEFLPHAVRKPFARVLRYPVVVLSESVRKNHVEIEKSLRVLLVLLGLFLESLRVFLSYCKDTKK